MKGWRAKLLLAVLATPTAAWGQAPPTLKDNRISVDSRSPRAIAIRIIRLDGTRCGNHDVKLTFGNRQIVKICGVKAKILFHDGIEAVQFPVEEKKRYEVYGAGDRWSVRLLAQP